MNITNSSSSRNSKNLRATCVSWDCSISPIFFLFQSTWTSSIIIDSITVSLSTRYCLIQDYNDAHIIHQSMLILLLYLTYEKTLNVLWKSFMYSSLIFSQYDIFFLIHGHCLLHLILVWHSPYQSMAIVFVIVLMTWEHGIAPSFFFYRQVVIGRQKLLYLIKSISIC